MTSQNEITSSDITSFNNDLEKIDFKQLYTFFNNNSIFDDLSYTGRRKDIAANDLKHSSAMKHIQSETALKLKLIVDSTAKTMNKTWYKRLQLFYNAYVLESILTDPNNGCGFVFYTDDHVELKTGSAGIDRPDFICTKDDETHSIELKIYGNEKAKQRSSTYHKADYVLIFRLLTNEFEWLKKGDNDSYKSISQSEDKFLNKIKLPSKTDFNFIELFIDFSQLDDYNALFCKQYGHSFAEALTESHGAYSNELDLTKALENKDECLKLIREQYGYDGPIETGGFYIMPDGTAVKSVNHADIDKFLVRNKYITGKVEDYGDGSQFMDAINCVRIRRRGGRDSWILPYMILPQNQLTQIQYNIIRDWIDFVMRNSGELSIQTMTGECKNYRSYEDTDEIMMDIRRYYRLNFFEGYESIYEPEIDDTDYELERDLKKGFYNQF